MSCLRLPEENERSNDSTPFLPLRIYVWLGGGLAYNYMAIVLFYPTVGAVIASIFIVAILGLLTTNVILRIDNPRRLWWMTPLCGLGWLLLLWMAFELKILFF